MTKAGGFCTIQRGRYYGIGTRYCFGTLYKGLRYSVFRWSCDGQVLTAYAVQVAGIVVRYAVY